MRKVIESDGNLIQDSTIPGTDMQKLFTQVFRENMQERLKARPELFDAIVPEFAPGCRRLTPGVGYLESLMEPNVEVVTDPIASITETGIRLASGRDIPLDVICCATGFKVSEAPPFEVVGRNGQTLKERWAPIPESYM